RDALASATGGKPRRCGRWLLVEKEPLGVRRHVKRFAEAFVGILDRRDDISVAVDDAHTLTGELCLGAAFDRRLFVGLALAQLPRRGGSGGQRTQVSRHVLPLPRGQLGVWGVKRGALGEPLPVNRNV